MEAFEWRDFFKTLMDVGNLMEALEIFKKHLNGGTLFLEALIWRHM